MVDNLGNFNQLACYPSLDMCNSTIQYGNGSCVFQQAQQHLQNSWPGVLIETLQQNQNNQNNANAAIRAATDSRLLPLCIDGGGISAESQTKIFTTLNSALEFDNSGITRGWRNDNVGSSGTVTVGDTVKNKYQTPCREFKLTLTTREGKSSQMLSAACRNNNQWVWINRENYLQTKAEQDLGNRCINSNATLGSIFTKTDGSYEIVKSIYGVSVRCPQSSTPILATVESMNSPIKTQMSDLDTLIKASEQGNAEAQNKLGEAYFKGELGVTKNQVLALGYFTQAAAQDNSMAQAMIGWMNEQGLGNLTINYFEAARYYKLSGSKDNALALNNLAVLYEKGLGVNKDPDYAIILYKKSARLGNPIAQDNLKKKNITYND